jgi:hypothetical protein
MWGHVKSVMVIQQLSLLFFLGILTICCFCACFFVCYIVVDEERFYDKVLIFTNFSLAMVSIILCGWFASSIHCIYSKIEETCSTPQVLNFGENLGNYACFSNNLCAVYNAESDFFVERHCEDGLWSGTKTYNTSDFTALVQLLEL